MVRFVNGQVIYGPHIESVTRAHSFTVQAVLIAPGPPTTACEGDPDTELFIARLASWLVSVALNRRGVC